LLVALLTITLVALRIEEGSQGSTLFISVVLAKSEVAFAATTALRPLEKSLRINISLRQL
jgi:hypothetical protein